LCTRNKAFPDIAYGGKGVDPASKPGAMVIHGQEFTPVIGVTGNMHLKEHLLLPGYAGYPNTAAASHVSDDADVYDMAHAQGALVGAVIHLRMFPDPYCESTAENYR